MNKPTRNRLPRGEKELLRKVDRLHPTVEVKLSPADLCYYQSLGPWAMALDRQSKSKELKREEATGQQNRVRNVLRMAADLNLLLPPPPENVDRKEGEFQFRFDEDACRYHWFVDGLEGDASGFTASPLARLQLWRMAKIARELRRHGCAPQAILVGELTRFFRSQQHFMDWYHILKGSGAAVRIYGYPELTAETEDLLLPSYLTATGAQSVWLKRQVQMARESHRQRRQLFVKVAPFSLQFNLDKSSEGYLKQVFPHPIEWPLLQEFLAQLAAGTFTSRNSAMAWFVERCEAAGVQPDRIPQSRSWLSKILQSTIPEGVYQQYRLRFHPCKIEDEEMKEDWDLTSNGNRRYLVEETPDRAISFPILLTPQEQIDPETLLAARQALSRKGRPRRGKRSWAAAALVDQGAQSCLRDGIIHCQTCGCTVFERPPRRMKERRWDHWTRLQDEQMLQGVYAGKTNAQIAEEFGWPVHRVDHRRSHLKLRGFDLAQDRAALDAYWEEPFERRMNSWHLYCRCIQELTEKHTRRVEDVKEWPEVQHHRKRNGSITLAIEPLLWQALREDPQTPIGALKPVVMLNTPALEAEEARLVERIRKIQADYETGNWGFYTEEEARVRLVELRQQRANLQSQIAAARGSLLDQNDLQDTQDWEMIRTRLRAMLDSPRFQQGHEFRRRIVEACVLRVEVNLETGFWEADTRFIPEKLHHLSGQVLLAPAEVASKDTDPWVCNLKHKYFTLRGHVRLAA